MAQYDVYPNPSTSIKDGIPYVVVVQSDLLDGLVTRLVIPLATLNFAGKAPSALCPRINVNDQHFYALAHYAAPLPAKLLRSPVDNVLDQASLLVGAVDAVLAGV
jgi:toxin CcdB